DQDALAVGRVVRNDFFEQVGAVGQFLAHVPYHEAAMFFVERIQRALRLRPVRVDRERRMQAVGKAPEQLKAIPAQVKGNVGQCTTPTAQISTRAESSRVSPPSRRTVMRHCASASSKRASITSVPKRICERSSYLSAMRSK